MERGRPQMKIWRMRTACWIPKATNPYSAYVNLIACPLQKLLQERVSMFRYYVHCLSCFLVCPAVRSSAFHFMRRDCELFRSLLVHCSSDVTLMGRSKCYGSFVRNNQLDASNMQNLYSHKNLHISGIFCAHHQELSTAHSALVCSMQVYDDRFQAESG